MNQELILWLFGSINAVLLVVLAALFKIFASHDRECRQRWEKFMNEHGALQSKVNGNADEITRLRNNQHDLRDKLPDIIRQYVRICKSE